jgi:hypothetical protein
MIPAVRLGGTAGRLCEAPAVVKKIVPPHDRKLAAKHLPINYAARNAVWVYPRVAEPRFSGAPAIVETARSYEMPALTALPGGSDVAVELYGRAGALWIDGESSRVYVRRFHYASIASQGKRGWRSSNSGRGRAARVGRGGGARGRQVAQAPGLRSAAMAPRTHPWPDSPGSSPESLRGRFVPTGFRARGEGRPRPRCADGPPSKLSFWGKECGADSISGGGYLQAGPPP